MLLKRFRSVQVHHQQSAPESFLNLLGRLHVPIEIEARCVHTSLDACSCMTFMNEACINSTGLVERAHSLHVRHRHSASLSKISRRNLLHMRRSHFFEFTAHLQLGSSVRAKKTHVRLRTKGYTMTHTHPPPEDSHTYEKQIVLFGVVYWTLIQDSERLVKSSISYPGNETPKCGEGR